MPNQHLQVDQKSAKSMLRNPGLVQLRTKACLHSQGGCRCVCVSKVRGPPRRQEVRTCQARQAFLSPCHSPSPPRSISKCRTYTCPSVPCADLPTSSCCSIDPRRSRRSRRRARPAICAGIGQQTSRNGVGTETAKTYMLTQ